MSGVQITCDSACDLPQAVSRRYRIDQLAMGVHLGKKFYQDRAEVSSGDLYAYSEQTGDLPEISAVTVEDYKTCFLHHLSQGREVVHISLSSQLSQCYQNACIAAESLKGVYVVDSCSISTGAGHLAMLGAELACADYRAAEIAEALNEMKQNLDVSFILQSPAYLHRSGRAGGLTALGARLLHVRPEIEVQKGAIRTGRPFRGDMEQTILQYVKSRLQSCRRVQTDRIFITYSGVPQAILDQVVRLLKQLQPFEQILTIPASSAVSCRCGPGCLGLAFMTNR